MRDRRYQQHSRAHADRAQNIGLLMLQPPDPVGRAAQRWGHALLKGLAQEGHEVTLISSFGDDEWPMWQSRLSGRAVRWPRFARRSHSTLLARLRARFRAFGDDYTRDDIRVLHRLTVVVDWLFCDETFSGWAGFRSGCPALLHSHCLRSLDLPITTVSWRNRVRFRRMYAAEKNIVRRFLCHATASSRVAHTIRAWNPDAHIDEIPLTIDPEIYPFIPDEVHRQSLGRVNLFGSMDWAPNSQAARRLLTKIWPRIRGIRGGSRLQIIGPDARHLVEPGDDGETGVEILDRVPDIEPHWKRAGVLLFPIERGSGVKIKVLEALAYGIPIVTTRAGAEGLLLTDGETALIRDDDDGLIEASMRLLQDYGLQQKLRHEGRRHLETELNLRVVARRFAQAGDGMLRRCDNDTANSV